MLDSFTWKVPSGRTVLLGANGAGKSTVLGIGSGALTPRSGSATVLDTAYAESRRAPVRKARRALLTAVGWMPQDVRAMSGLTAREQVAYAGWLKGLPKKAAWETAATALDDVGLADRHDAKASTLSGGQLRRVGLAEVLVFDPRVLLLDEPTVGLDPAQRARFREVITGLEGTRPVVVSTHQVDDLDELFDHVVVIHRGSIAFEGTVDAFLDHGEGRDLTRRAESAYRTLTSGATP
ncbi:ABC transporter ATP-binding protein [Myceligenerans halotolerans]